MKTYPFYYLLDRTVEVHPELLKENDTRLDGFDARLVMWK